MSYKEGFQVDLNRLKCIHVFLGTDFLSIQLYLNRNTKSQKRLQNYALYIADLYNTVSSVL